MRYLVTRACWITYSAIPQPFRVGVPQNGRRGKRTSSSAIPGQLGFRKLSQVFERQAGDSRVTGISSNEPTMRIYQRETMTQTGPRSATTLLVSSSTVSRQLPPDLWVLPETSTQLTWVLLVKGSLVEKLPIYEQDRSVK